tara:strand:- start:4082 stop:5251 length:1170 start_codon:yes stop_codon:yes gene_type:complete
MSNQMLDNIAKTLNVAPEVVQTRADTVLVEQGAAWKNAGRSDEDCAVLALRVAGRQISSESARLRRTGSDVFEGMFISVPRPKEWGKILYNKMKNQLMSATTDVRQVLVDSGAVVVFEDNNDGSYTRLAAEMFGIGVESDVSALPAHTMRLDGTTHFYVVWDKNNPTFPSGDANFKYGAPRPQDERERTSLFYGRKQGTNDSLKILKVSGNGAAADRQYPSFVPLTIPMKAGNNDRCYLNADVSIPTVDTSLSSLFDGSPTDIIGGLIGAENLLGGLSELGTYYDTYNGKDGWWDRNCAVITEVIHIDPRDKGGYILVCADTDMTSLAGTVDVYVDDEIDFAVGSKMLLLGGAWRSREGEDRMSVNGWYAFDIIPQMVEPAVENDGWEA